MSQSNASTNGKSLLRVNNLTTEFRTASGTIVANRNVSIWVDSGKTLGIVGESGSGKSVLCRSILRILPSPPARTISGEIWFGDRDLTTLSEREMQAIRGVEIGMIFQDPMTSLNPVWSVGDQITESLRVHKGIKGKQAREIGINLLQQVGIPSPQTRIDDHPHKMSGGMRQRVVIAMAMACQPKLLLADEPTTALDVTIQDQILALMVQLQEQTGMSIVLVSHDMGVVAETTDWVAVMYAGQVIETASTTRIFNNPRHPYTVGLLNSIPRMENKVDRLTPMQGQPPNLLKLPKGCPFSDRCPVATPDCAETPVALREVEAGHFSACLYPERL